MSKKDELVEGKVYAVVGRRGLVTVWKTVKWNDEAHVEVLSADNKVLVLGAPYVSDIANKQPVYAKILTASGAIGFIRIDDLKEAT